MSAGAPSKDWKETVAPDESERFEAYAQQLRELQQHNAKAGRPHRALHAKLLLGARAELTVLPNLPEHARVGLFAAPKTYSAWVRFSNGGSSIKDDRKPDIRGLAIKLIGAPGRKLIPGMEDARTQDFLMIQTPVSPFQNSEEFMLFVLGSTNPLTLLAKSILNLGLRRTLAILSTFKQRIAQPVPTLAALRFWSVAPIKFGPYAVRFSARPTAAPNPPHSLAKGSDYLTEDLEDRLANGPLSYDFMVQFFVDEKRTPIENAASEWLESDAPFVTVARLTLFQQQLRSPEGRRIQEYVEQLSFDPWHAAEDFRPIGQVMRARNPAYRVSTQTRQAAKEPEDAELPQHS